MFNLDFNLVQISSIEKLIDEILYKIKLKLINNFKKGVTIIHNYHNIITKYKITEVILHNNILYTRYLYSINNNETEYEKVEKLNINYQLEHFKKDYLYKFENDTYPIYEYNDNQLLILYLYQHHHEYIITIIHQLDILCNELKKNKIDRI